LVVKAFTKFQRVKHVTASQMYGNFTFVSPTVYLAHRPLSFSYGEGAVLCDDSSCRFTTTGLNTVVVRPPGIIPVHSTNVYIIRNVRYTMNGTDLEAASPDTVYVASGSMVDEAYLIPDGARPLDFKDLSDTVPASAYLAARDDCWGKQTHCGMITDDTFRPSIWLDDATWNSIFPDEGVVCGGGDLDDPPEAFPLANEGYPDEAPPLFPQVTHPSEQQHINDNIYAKLVGTIVPHVPSQTPGPEYSDRYGFYRRPVEDPGNSGSSISPSSSGSLLHCDQGYEQIPSKEDGSGGSERNDSVESLDKGKANRAFGGSESQHGVEIFRSTAPRLGIL
jgi:hypothetical protein